MVFNWIVNIIVIAGVSYLAFAMALAGWFASLKRGEAVTLVQTRVDSKRNTWVQMAVAIISLIITVFIIIWLWIPLPIHFSKAISTTFLIIGLILFIGGTLITLWARRTLGRMWGISTSRKVKLLDDHQLIDEGPYGLVRHPMYAGWISAMFGLLLIYWNWITLLFFASSALVFYRRARREEAVLAERFGEQWQAYVQRSKFLIPWIY